MEEINQFRKLFTNYLSQQAFDRRPHELYEPINYVMNMGGKRIRPVLVLLSHHLFDDQVDRSLPIAYAVEMFHNFSLVHDDIMDEAAVRRTKPTVHHKYGVNTGILSGDVMLVYVYHYLGLTGQEVDLPMLIKTFNEVAIKVCEGQQMDMNFENTDAVTLQEYVKMIELKTAALLSGSLGLGAISGGASQKDVHHLQEFGKCMGIAFQLQDDYLDAYGEQQKVGKRVGGDILQNKKTFLVTKALEVADAPLRTKLLSILHDKDLHPDRKISDTLSIFNRLDIPRLAKEHKKIYQEQGLQHLEAVDAPAVKKSLLEGLALNLLEREY